MVVAQLTFSICGTGTDSSLRKDRVGCGRGVSKICPLGYKGLLRYVCDNYKLEFELSPDVHYRSKTPVRQYPLRYQVTSARLNMAIARVCSHSFGP